MKKEPNLALPGKQELNQAISIIQQAGLKITLQEDLFQTIIDQAPFPISLVECPDLRYILANPAMRSNLKNSENFHLGSTVGELDNCESTRKRNRLLVQIQKTGKPVHLQEIYTSVGPEDREAWWNLDLLPLIGKSGTVDYILILEQEVTDLVNDRQQLERSNRELQEFAFVASHDLKEPLRKINAFGEMLLTETENLSEQQLDYLNRMTNAAARMHDMVEELLKLSRLTTYPRTFVRVDLGQIVSEVISDLEVQVAQTSASIMVEPLPTVVGDLLLIRQLFQNLIGNALKFHQPDVAPQVQIYHEKLPGDAIRVYIQDNGIGFSMEDAERIFQPFQRLVSRSRYDGNGMGLAICRKIVDRHGGTIYATSKPGQGATFIVTLPLGYIPRMIGRQP
jgi:signal transduction histidine kinase